MNARSKDIQIGSFLTFNIIQNIYTCSTKINNKFLIVPSRNPILFDWQ